MIKDNINSREYWNTRFDEDWTLAQGEEQTQFFAEIAIKLMPDWFLRKLKIEKMSVCDMGCAKGQAVDYMSKFFGYKIAGADFAIEAINHAKESYPENEFTVVDLNDIPKNFKYDVVFCSNVLEHFTQPWKIVENLTRNVEKYIVLLIPFQESMQVDEHVFKFDTNNIPININQFSLVYSSAIDGRKIEHTYYADKQILLIYSSIAEDKKIVTMDIMENAFRLDNKVSNYNIINKYDELEVQYKQIRLNFDELLSDKAEYLDEKSSLIKKQQRLQSEISLLKNLNSSFIEQQKSLFSEISLLKDEKELLINKYEEIIRELDETKSSKEKINKWYYGLVEEEAVLRDQYQRMKFEYEQFREDIYKSFSWRITKIFRILGTITRFSILHQKIISKKENKNIKGNLATTAMIRIKRSRVYPIIKKIVPNSLKYKLARKYSVYLNNFETETDIAFDEKLNLFIQSISNETKVLMVFSGVKYVDSEGQRNIRLVHEAMLKGVKVIFAYWRWDNNEEIEQGNENMFQIPIDYLYQNRVTFFDNYLSDNKNKTFLIEFPHPLVIEILDIANCYNWTTVYDVIDDWEEFSKLGQAIWYDKLVETRVANMVDFNIATALRLKEKISSRIITKKPYYIISNGVDPNRIRKAERNKKYDFRKGKIQIGYFGHLTDAWFDWDLVKGLANLHEDWSFHIIGYGQPEELKLPENIILYGKKQPSELAEYAAFWDVAIIPFINCELTLSVNPIKIYEYLQLQLPVVASNMPEVKNFPFTQIAIGVKEFENAIIKAKDMKVDSDIVTEFIQCNTWEHKLDALYECIDKFDVIDTYKNIYT